MPYGRDRSQEEIERILLRQIKRGARDARAVVQVSPELEALKSSRALQRAASAFAQATRSNFNGEPLKPPSGWFPPLL